VVDARLFWLEEDLRIFMVGVVRDVLMLMGWFRRFQILKVSSNAVGFTVSASAVIFYTWKAPSSF
jgi:hypothetical protein